MIAAEPEPRGRLEPEPSDGADGAIVDVEALAELATGLARRAGEAVVERREAVLAGLRTVRRHGVVRRRRAQHGGPVPRGGAAQHGGVAAAARRVAL